MMEGSIEDDFTCLLMEFNESKNKLITIKNNYLKHNNEEGSENTTNIFGLLTSYVLGEFKKNDTDRFLLQYYDSLDDVEVYNMIDKWTEYLNNNLSQKEITDMVRLLLKTIGKFDGDVDQIMSYRSGFIGYLSRPNKETLDQFSLKMTARLWKFKTFRKSIENFPKEKTGIEYFNNGIFCSYSFNSYYGGSFEKLLDSISPLINDETIHDALIIYINNIMKVNISYTYQDWYKFLQTHQCSTIYYNVFLMRVLMLLINYYSLKTITNAISENVYSSKSYELDNLPLYHKLFVTTLFAIRIGHLSIIKSYQQVNDRYKFASSALGALGALGGTSASEKRRLASDLESIKKLIKLGEKKIVQNMYIEYVKLHENIKIDCGFNDLVEYIDYVTVVFNDKKENPYGDLNSEFYVILSDVMGGFGNDATNSHLRFYASQILLKILPEFGFKSFGKLFNNLFKFISEVDFFKWTRTDVAIYSQKSITDTLVQLIDFTDKILEEPGGVIAGTLFSLLKRSTEIFNMIDNICSSNGRIVRLNELGKLFEAMLNIMAKTLLIHSTLYEKKIITTVYPEVEERYVLLIAELLTTSTDTNHGIYKVLKRPDMAAKITHVAYKSLDSHIEFTQDALIKIKDIIISKMEYSQLSKERQELIKKLLNKENIELEYPSEFIDPILCSVINYPVKIPNVSEFFDRTSILTHIYEYKKNPYTREELTVEIFTEYNSRPEVIEEIHKFMERKKKFEDENNGILTGCKISEKTD